MHMSALVTITMASTTFLHVFWLFIFVNQLNMGITGLGLATMISYAWNFTVITVICMVIKELR